MRTWILQSNPSRVDLDAYLTSGDEPIFHGAKRYVRQISVGDCALLWRARGGTRLTPGIVAIATVVEPAELRPHPHAELCRVESVRLPKLRVALRLEQVRLTPAAGMISRDDVRRLPEMSRHPIVTSNTGTDFALSDEQVDALMSLWHEAMA